MTAWWESIGILEQVFFLIAAPATLIIIAQTVLLIFGGGMDDALSGHADTPDAAEMADGPDGNPEDASASDATGLRLLSVRGIMAFLTVFGWTGVVMLEAGVHQAVTILTALILGSAALYLMAVLIRSLMNLQESGSADYRRALGKSARVYLTIPSAGNGQGKINFMLGDALREAWAVTDSSEAIPTGTAVRVIDLAGGVYTVERE